MTAKDYVYLALMVLTAVIFYVHGFRAGAEQTKTNLSRYYRRRAESAAPAVPAPLPPAQAEPPPALDREMTPPAAPAASWPALDRLLGLRGDFSNN